MKTDKFPVYIHMEKCGGMSLHHALRYAIPGYQVLKPWWYWSNEPGHYFSSDELRFLKRFLPGLNGIGGHTTRSYAAYEDVLEKPIFYFTFLRDPVSRYLSHLNHQVNKMGFAWKVEEFLKEKRFNNLMTRRIAGGTDLELAKRRLRDDFGMVGLFESYEKSLVVLSDMIFGIPNGLHYEHLNDSTNEIKIAFDDLSSNSQGLVLDNNSLDIGLYEYAKCELFPKYIESYSRDLKTDVEEFRIENETFRYDRSKWYFSRLWKAYSERIPQRLAHRFAK